MKHYCGLYKGYMIYQDGEMIGSNWYGTFFAREKQANGRYAKVKDSEFNNWDSLKIYLDKMADEKRMPFNNRFDEKQRIIFKPSEWICTDPDEMQFCRPISKTEFEYIQLSNMELKLKYQHGYGKNLLKNLNKKTTLDDWEEEVIDVSKLSEEEIREYVSPYGYHGILDDWKDEQSRYQIIAECAFETDNVFV